MSEPARRRSSLMAPETKEEAKGGGDGAMRRLSNAPSSLSPEEVRDPVGQVSYRCCTVQARLELVGLKSAPFTLHSVRH